MTPGTGPSREIALVYKLPSLCTLARMGTKIKLPWGPELQISENTSWSVMTVVLTYISVRFLVLEYSMTSYYLLGQPGTDVRMWVLDDNPKNNFSSGETRIHWS